MKTRLCILLCLLPLLAVISPCARAQFKEQPFQQNYNSEPVAADTSDVLFSFPEFFGGLAGKNEVKIGSLFGGSTILIGSSQIYNKHYWKLPLIYGGIAGGLTGGILNLQRYKQTGDPSFKNRYPWFFVGAGLCWYASLMDGVVCYHPDRNPLPGRATLYSILCPGLGQVYNGEYWKIPIYYGCIIGAVHFYIDNKTNYERFKRIYDEASDPATASRSPIPASTAKWYKDEYRRYRDYSLLAIAGFYLLQIIDANVFAYMHDFEVSDDLTMKVSPAVITPDRYYASAWTQNPTSVGLRLGLTF